MIGINEYGNELTKKDIENKLHREFVGGLWEEIGALQYNFLLKRGLKPHHKLLDIGCGSLRGGCHFIKYLDEGNYYGLDINSSLIEAGKLEIEEAALESKYPNLLVDEQFRFERFNEYFDFMLSQSLFTHLPMNIIVRCLCEVRNHLKPGGVYFSTFLQAPKSAHLDEIHHNPGGFITNYDCAPFHYSFEELSWMASIAELEATLVKEEDWIHPRNQKMAVFYIGK
uniref:Methyltransferase domain-containing protein n=1 Tax=Candidatus Kentrum sp. LFY TaxID=2126342 RepID=A0A450WT87_9GAMM|nr:MAG: Methyltransferase domain-containing protein [Candidatus Kentron sp. LFY]